MVILDIAVGPLCSLHGMLVQWLLPQFCGVLAVFSCSIWIYAIIMLEFHLTTSTGHLVSEKKRVYIVILGSLDLGKNIIENEIWIILILLILWKLWCKMLVLSCTLLKNSLWQDSIMVESSYWVSWLNYSKILQLLSLDIFFLMFLYFVLQGCFLSCLSSNISRVWRCLGF